MEYSLGVFFVEDVSLLSVSLVVIVLAQHVVGNQLVVIVLQFPGAEKGLSYAEIGKLRIVDEQSLSQPPISLHFKCVIAVEISSLLAESEDNCRSDKLTNDLENPGTLVKN